MAVRAYLAHAYMSDGVLAGSVASSRDHGVTREIHHHHHGGLVVIHHGPEIVEYRVQPPSKSDFASWVVITSFTAIVAFSVRKPIRFCFTCPPTQNIPIFRRVQG